MSVMQKLLEINDELVKVLEERDRLQAQLAEVKNQLEAVVQERYNLQTELNTKDKQLQDVCSVKPAEQDGVLVQEGWWLQADGNRVYVRPTNPTANNKGDIAQGYIWSDGVRLYHSDGGHGDTPTPHDLVKFLGKHVKTKPAEQNGLVRDVSHYTPAAEVDRPIEPQPQADTVQVCEGRWQTRNGEIFNVTPTPECRIHTSDSRAERFPWWDAQYRQTWCANGKYHFGRESSLDLVTYLGPIESEPEQEFKPYTFAAYIVGDKSQPDALRIVWATEEWIQHANFGIVHRMSDLKFSGNDTFTPDQFSVNLKVQ